MVKKITSIFVIAAAMLLALPVDAQVARRSFSSKELRTNKPVLVQKQQAEAQATAQAEASISADEKYSIVYADAISKFEQTDLGVALARMPQWHGSTQSSVNLPLLSYVERQGKPFGKVNGDVRRLSNSLTPVSKAPTARRNAPRKAETVDANGVITAIPEGDTKIYQRTGLGWYVSNQQIYNDNQGGNAEITELEDGTVYFKDFLSQVGVGTYVKGTREGNTITIPVGQVIYYWASYDYGLKLGWASYDATNGFDVAEGGDYTLTVDEEANTITLEGTHFDFDTNDGLIAAAIYTDEDLFSGYGDNNTVFTYDPDYVAPEPTTLPEGVEAEDWFTEGNTVNNSGSTDFEGTAKVAIVGDQVYLGGLFSQFPDSYIVGTIAGDQVTFESLQFLGNYSSYEIYATGTDESVLTDFVMTYDADKQILTGSNLLANAATDKIYYLSWIENITISKNEIEHAIEPVDVLPYTNDFADAAAQKQFTVINANEDNVTWTAGSGNFTISYADHNDDWLVSPAIKLQAGKKYHFAVDAWARSSSFPETFEVKIATELTAEALAAGADVIAQTELSNLAAQTFETEELTVEADGYYYIGIHNVSDDAWIQYVDNFLIEAAPLVAPVTLDLTNQDNAGLFGVIDNNGDGRTWAWSANYGIYYAYSSTQAADDYAILPIKLEAGKNYNVVLEVAAQSSTYAPEKFSVVAGTGANIEDWTTTVIAEKSVAHTDWQEYDGVLTTDVAGTYYIAIHATSDADKYYLKVRKLTVEAGAEGDAPAAVDNFAVAPVEEDELGAVVSFNAPTKKLDGTDLAAGDIVKIDILRDGAVINTIDAPAPGAALTYTDKGDDLTIGNHTYQAVTYGESGIGGKSEEVTVFLSATLTVPYVADFTQQSTFAAFQVINNNNDGTTSTWRWDASYSAYYTYSSSNDADDYLVSSPIQLEAGKNYKITVNARSYSANYPERFEVVYGTEPTAAGLNKVAIGPTDVANGDYEDFESDFTVAADGKYYVAVHAISDADMWRLQVSKLSIEKGLEPNAPAAPGLEVRAGDEGALAAQVTLTAPTTSIDGNPLGDNLSKIVILVDGEAKKTVSKLLLDAADGEYIGNVSVSERGNHTFQAVPYDADGEAGQRSEKITLYIGEDDLGSVQNFAIAGSTPTTIDFTWDQVAGANGGYVNLSGVKYHIYSLQVLDNGYWQYLDIVEELAEVEGATNATVNFPVDEGQSGYQYFGISAETATGTEGDPTASYTYIIVGAPEELPIQEGFAGNQFHYNWNTNGGAYISTLDSDGDGTALLLISEEDNTTIYFQLDKVNLAQAANPTLLFDVHSGNINQVRVIGAANAGTPSTLQTVNLTDNWQTVKVPLNAVKSPRSTVGLEADFANYSYVSQYGSTWGDTLVIDNIKIVDLLEYNLAVSVRAPKSVTAGGKATATVTVLNTGENAAKNYTVKLTANGEELLNETVADALGFYESKTFEADYATTIFTEAGDVTLTAEVVYANDLDEDDNISETIITVNEPSATAPGNVVASQSGTDADINVSWTAPTDATQTVVDDVEAYNDNDGSMYTGTNQNGSYNGPTAQIGEWTVYDGNNGLWGYGFEGLTSNLGNPGSWIVFNPLAVDAGLTNYTAHSGDKYFISTCVAQPDDAIDDTDNWLISPELPGVAQTVSFWVRELVADYGAESYEIWVSSTDKQISSFQKIASETVTTAEWTEVSYNLPEGTKYFAIRHISNDVWALLVDDVTFQQGGGEVAGFNIYVDGELYSSVEGNVTNTTVSVEDLEAGQHVIAVTATYAGGAESKPITAVVDVTTGIKLVFNGQEAVDVYSVDGKLVRKQTLNLDGLKGAYIVNNKKVVLK